MRIDEGGIQTKFFFGGVGVHFTANFIEVGIDFVGTSFLCSFEKKMFGKMCQSILGIIFFIAGAHISNDGPMPYLGMFNALVNQLQSVGEAMDVNHKTKVRWIIGRVGKLLKKLFGIPEMFFKINDLIFLDG